jgi:hypothetical protein
MFCPSCGGTIDDNSRYCIFCGKSPRATVAAGTPSAREEDEPRESHTLRNVLLGVGLIALVVLAISNSSLRSSAGLAKREPLTPATFSVKAGSMYFVMFTVTGPARVIGRFEASGGQGNDIQVVLTDADDFENWKNGHQANVLYQSEKTTVGTINVPISRAGTYYLAFNNQFSILSDKTITGNIQLER